MVTSIPESDAVDSEPPSTAISPHNSTRSCPGNLASSLTRRCQLPRRNFFSYSEKISGNNTRNLQPLVHSMEPSLERISEDAIITVEIGEVGDKTPTAPPRPSRVSMTGNPDASGVLASSSPMSPALSQESQRTLSEVIEITLNKHYYTIAYTLVIAAYFIGFAEYLYFRLVSLLAPDHSIHYANFHGQQLRVGKDGFHYGVSIAAFTAIALFQLICFFGLTISENWTVCFSTERDEISLKRRQISVHIKMLIRKTIYRVFLCYAICSVINCAIIFYMVGVQDSLGDTVSVVLLYVFDAVVIIYFISFPLATIVYHPHVRCFQKTIVARIPVQLTSAISQQEQQNIRSQSSTLESQISNLEEYVESPARPPRTVTVV